MQTAHVFGRAADARVEVAQPPAPRKFPEPHPTTGTPIVSLFFSVAQGNGGLMEDSDKIGLAYVVAMSFGCAIAATTASHGAVRATFAALAVALALCAAAIVGLVREARSRVDFIKRNKGG